MPNIKTIVINLARRQDRKEKMLQRLKESGFTNYSFYEAVDGELIDKEMIPIALRNHFRKGVYGCALSHLFAVISAFENDSDLQHLLVLEDDVVFSNAIKNIDNYIDTFKEADMFYLGFTPIQSLLKFEDKRKGLIGTHTVKAIRSGANGLFAYIINRKFLQKFSDAINEFVSPCDNAIMNLQGNKELNFYCVTPFICTVEEDFSDTSNCIVKHDFKGLDKQCD